MGNPQWAHISDYEVTYGTNKYSPVIELMDAAGNIVGKLCIIPDEEKPPNNRLVMEGIPHIYYHLQDFKNVLRVLRNQKPIWLCYDPLSISADSEIAAEPRSRSAREENLA